MADILKWLFGSSPPQQQAAPQLPEALLPFAAKISATERPVLAVTSIAPRTDVATGSQLGGVPWWPKARAWPLDSGGQPLFLLLQVNLAEVPAMAPLPRTGLLQLFIASGDVYGCNFNDQRKPGGFACIYHAECTAEPLRDFDFLRHALESKTAYLPLETPLLGRGLMFAASSMPVTPSDYRFEKLLPEISANDALTEMYFEHFAPPAIRLGGYPTFTQEDPRSYRSGHGLGDFTLATIDTTDGIMWGDSGAAQFLIDEKALAAGAFDQVTYNWDCL